MLINIERSEITIATEKSIFYASGIKIMGFVYNYYGRYLNKDKVCKICVWKKCNNATEARAFLRIYIYFRI